MSVIGQIAGSCLIFQIWCHGWYRFSITVGDLKQQYLELDLRAVRPLIMVLKVFWNNFFIFGWSGTYQFLAAVYSYQHMTFMRLHQHASSALISLLLITWSLIDLTWFIRSDDISLLWSDLVIFLFSFCWKVLLVWCRFHVYVL